MGSISTFTFCSLNGYYKDQHHGIDWHVHGPEEAQYSADSLSNKNILLLGRLTYDMMVSFWPTSAASDAFPEVAKGMNEAEKLVVLRTLSSSKWQNTRILKSGWIEELTEIKKSKNITLLGSGSLLNQLTDADLIDRYGIMIDPVLLGRGTPMFNKLHRSHNLELVDHRVFSSGAVLLNYQKKQV